MSQVTSSDGVQLAVREQGAHDGVPIVFIHGYPETKEMWSAVLARLPERFHAITYDVRGAGGSTRPRGNAAYDFERLGDDLVAVCQAVAPDRAVHLVGHDWGGLQGWEFATRPRFRGRLASYTAIAGPSLDQVTIGGEELLRRGRVLRWLARMRRSWYIVALLTPGVPTLIWRLLASPERWEHRLRDVEGVPAAEARAAPTLREDGAHGAKLYRRNMPRRALRPRRDAFAHVPVQLIVPTRDRFISTDYYDLAPRYAPALVRRELDSSHWAPRERPDELAAWLEGFVDEVEKDSDRRERNAPHAPETSPATDR